MENVDQTEGRGRYRLFMLLIMALSAGLNLFRLNRVGINGFANTYYSAAVKAMLTSWHNFFYLSFDPAGFLALDKPPLTYWIQALSARIFGFNGVSLLMPQVLAGILSVWLLYRLVRRAYGEWAGLLAALALAVAPINVVTNRNNTGEALGPDTGHVEGSIQGKG